MPTVYRSTDTDAPVLTGLVGSLIAVLDACLVNGYGDKSAAGWTKAFSGTNQAAYRNDHTAGASGAYFLIEDDAPGGTSGDRSRLSAYGAMSAVDDGTFATGYQWFRKGPASGDARPWVLVADGLTFWFYCWVNGDPDRGGTFTNARMCGAGDYDCADPDNAFRYFVLGSETGATNGNNTFAYFLTGDVAQALHPDGLTGQVRFAMQVPPSTSSNNSFGNIGNSAPISSFTSNVHFYNPALRVGDQYVGFFRGIRRPFNRMWELPESIPGELFAGTSLIFSPVNVSGTPSFTDDRNPGALMIDTEGPW